MPRAFWSALTAVFFALAAWTPPVAAAALTTTFAGGNGHNGNMFDVKALSDITVTGFSQNFLSSAPGGIAGYEIYVREGGFAGFENNPAGWTLLGSASGFSAVLGTATPIPIVLDFHLEADTIYGFYLTTTGGSDSVSYTEGTAIGALAASDANLEIYEGLGKAYPFGDNFAPRIWNGTITYELTNATAVPEPASLALLGAGILGLGWARRRRRI